MSHLWVIRPFGHKVQLCFLFFLFFMSSRTIFFWLSQLCLYTPTHNVLLLVQFYIQVMTKVLIYVSMNLLNMLDICLHTNTPTVDISFQADYILKHFSMIYEFLMHFSMTPGAVRWSVCVHVLWVCNWRRWVPALSSSPSAVMLRPRAPF